jgi:hypothetical protein
MATVLEGYNTEEQSYVVCCFASKGFDENDIDKEMFPVFCGKCLPRKAVHNSVEKYLQGRSKDADDARSGAEVAQTTVKRISVLWILTHW